jgi:hypothetical protein
VGQKICKYYWSRASRKLCRIVSLFCRSAADLDLIFFARIKFDDMHDTGIYPWSYLYYLGEKKVRLLKNYVFQLLQFKKERDPRKSYK